VNPSQDSEDLVPRALIGSPWCPRCRHTRPGLVCPWRIGGLEEASRDAACASLAILFRSGGEPRPGAETASPFTAVICRDDREDCS